MVSTSLWACALLLVVAAVTDIATRRIPNTVTLGGVVVGLALHAGVGAADAGAAGALRGLGVGVLGAIVCSIVPFVSWRRGEMGGGDVKLFAAVGALLGPLAGFDVQAMTFLITAFVLFPWRLVRQGALGAGLANLRIGVANLVRRRESRVPYVSGPKLRPVILAPTIGVAFVLSLVRHGALLG